MESVSIDSVGYVEPLGSVQITDQQNCVTTWPNTWTYYSVPCKSAREQVQDEILMKVAEAVKNEDLKRANELLKLAKALKEL